MVRKSWSLPSSRGWSKRRFEGWTFLEEAGEEDEEKTREEEKDWIPWGRPLYLFLVGRKEETGSNTSRKKCGVRSGTTRFHSPPDRQGQPLLLFEPRPNSFKASRLYICMSERSETDWRRFGGAGYRGERVHSPVWESGFRNPGWAWRFRFQKGLSFSLSFCWAFLSLLFAPKFKCWLGAKAMDLLDFEWSTASEQTSPPTRQQSRARVFVCHLPWHQGQSAHKHSQVLVCHDLTKYESLVLNMKMTGPIISLSRDYWTIEDSKTSRSDIASNCPPVFLFSSLYSVQSNSFYSTAVLYVMNLVLVSCKPAVWTLSRWRASSGQQEVFSWSEFSLFW